MDLFAGLVQACRYCGELEASVAAHERAHHLDPHVATSVAHTWFLLGDYQRTIEFYGTRGGFYLDCAARVMLGNNNEGALARLRERERSAAATGSVRAIMQSLRAWLDGDAAGCLHAIELGESQTRRDPETLFYTARHLAQIGEHERAVRVISEVVDSGFLCGSALWCDPWLTPLRALPEYSRLLDNVQQQQSRVHASFLEAGGPELLNMTSERTWPQPGMGASTPAQRFIVFSSSRPPALR